MSRSFRFPGSVRIKWFLPFSILFLSFSLSLAAVYPRPVFLGPQPVAVMACGDFNPARPGNEVAVLLADGSIVELAYHPSGWTTNTIFLFRGAVPIPWLDPRTRVSLNVADVLRENPGAELVLGFQQQVVVVYYAPGAGWTNQIVADFSRLVGLSWGAEAGDCDPAYPGDEIFSIYEGVLDSSAGTVYSETNGFWDQNFVYSGEVGMDAAIGDANPEHPGNEIVVVTEMGPAYEILPPEAGGFGPWPKRLIWNDFENAGWVVKVGEVDPAIPGNEIVYGTRYSNRILMSHHNGIDQHEVRILLTGTNTSTLNSMFDVAIGQVLPASEAAEVLGVDNSGSLYLAQLVNGAWNGSVLWHDANPLYAVLAADLIPTRGDEVLVAGASGTVTLLLSPAAELKATQAPGQHLVLSWDAVGGIDYYVETSTNLWSRSDWLRTGSVTLEDGFYGEVSYTNTLTQPMGEQFFRVQAAW